MRDFTIYCSNSYNDKFNAIYNKKRVIDTESSLVSVNKNDMVMAEYAGGHRDKNNFIKSNVLFADFDEGQSILDFCEKYGDYAWTLCTSKSHKKEKNGIVSDRFHVFFPLSEEITDINVYETYLKKLILEMGSDKACKDGARFFFGNKETEVISNLHDHKSFITDLLDTVELPVQGKKPAQNTISQNNNNNHYVYNCQTDLDKSTKTMVANSIEKVSIAQRGERNHTLYLMSAFIVKLENGGFKVGDWKSKMVSSALSAGLDLNEISASITSAESIYESITYEIKSSEQKKIDRENSKIEKTISWLLSNYDFRYDVLLSQTQFKEKSSSVYVELDDIEINTILNNINRTICISKQTLMSTIESRQVLEFHDSIADYFKNVEYDSSRDFIEELANTVKTTKQDTFVQLFKRWFVSSVGQMLGETTNHSALIFIERKGGTGKSTWLRRLSPIHESFEGTIDTNSKDSIRMISNKTHIILDELEATTRKSDFQALKSLITREDVCMREAYARKEKRFKRRASFCATTNNHIVINEAEGSRRWLTFEIAGTPNPIDYNFPTELLDKAYAQAYKLYKEGYRHYFNTEDIDLIMDMNEEFTVPNQEQQALNQFVEKGDEWHTTFQIVEHLTNQTNVKLNPKRIAERMKSLGFENKRSNKGRVYKCSLTYTNI